MTKPLKHTLQNDYTPITSKIFERQLCSQMAENQFSDRSIDNQPLNKPTNQQASQPVSCIKPSLV